MATGSGTGLQDLQCDPERAKNKPNRRLSCPPRPSHPDASNSGPPRKLSVTVRRLPGARHQPRREKSVRLFAKNSSRKFVFCPQYQIYPPQRRLNCVSNEHIVHTSDGKLDQDVLKADKPGLLDSRA